MSPRSRRAVLLVDYDNVRADTFTPERTAADVQRNLLELVGALFAMLNVAQDPYSEARLRLYGGWVHEDGRWTERADWLRQELPAVRGRSKGLRIVPEMGVALMSVPHADLRGTARIRTDRPGYRLQQKMVDTMIATDLLLLVAAPDEDVFVVSNDDDLVPPLLGAQKKSGRVQVVRRRSLGTRPNDHHLIATGIQIHVIP